jgi:hypothetical protein
MTCNGEGANICTGFLTGWNSTLHGQQATQNTQHVKAVKCTCMRITMAMQGLPQYLPPIHPKGGCMLLSRMCVTRTSQVLLSVQSRSLQLSRLEESYFLWIEGRIPVGAPNVDRSHLFQIWRHKEFRGVMEATQQHFLWLVRLLTDSIRSSSGILFAV